MPSYIALEVLLRVVSSRVTRLALFCSILTVAAMWIMVWKRISLEEDLKAEKLGL